MNTLQKILIFISLSHTILAEEWDFPNLDETKIDLHLHGEVNVTQSGVIKLSRFEELDDKSKKLLNSVGVNNNQEGKAHFFLLKDGSIFYSIDKGEFGGQTYHIKELDKKVLVVNEVINELIQFNGSTRYYACKAETISCMSGSIYSFNYNNNKSTWKTKTLISSELYSPSIVGVTRLGVIFTLTTVDQDSKFTSTMLGIGKDEVLIYIGEPKK